MGGTKKQFHYRVPRTGGKIPEVRASFFHVLGARGTTGTSKALEYALASCPVGSIGVEIVMWLFVEIGCLFLWVSL